LFATPNAFPTRFAIFVVSVPAIQRKAQALFFLGILHRAHSVPFRTHRVRHHPMLIEDEVIYEQECLRILTEFRAALH
jgi:hypothetical protein